MANGNAYPAVMLDPDAQVVGAGVTLQFTDSTDQPGAGEGGLVVTDGSTEIDGATTLNFRAPLVVLTDIDPMEAKIEFDPSQVVWVSVVSTPPTDFDAPLVYDNTPVTGGLYAWDGSAYQQVGNVVA